MLAIFMYAWIFSLDFIIDLSTDFSFDQGHRVDIKYDYSVKIHISQKHEYCYTIRTIPNKDEFHVPSDMLLLGKPQSLLGGDQ